MNLFVRRTAVLLALLVLPALSAPDTNLECACCANLKTLSTALEVYSTEHKGHYPEALSVLVPRYVPALPACPAAHSDTYSASFRVSHEPEQYQLCCQGNFHFDSNLPAIGSELGLIRGPAAEMAARFATPLPVGPPRPEPGVASPANAFTEGTVALNDHQLDKAEAAFRRALVGADRSITTAGLAQKSHGSLMLVLVLENKLAEADKEVAGLVKDVLLVEPEVLDELCNDEIKAADQLLRTRDFNRAEKLYALAIKGKPAAPIRVHAEVRYAEMLEAAKRSEDAATHFKLAIEGAMRNYSDCKKKGADEHTRLAAATLLTVADHYATYLIAHDRKAAAERVRSDAKQMTH